MHTVLPRHKRLRRGYGFVAFNSTDYPMYSESEREWVKLAALRDAMNRFPNFEWFWYLDQVCHHLNFS